MGRKRSQSKKDKEVSPKISPRQPPLSARELLREAGRTLSSSLLPKFLKNSGSDSSPDPSPRSQSSESENRAPLEDTNKQAENPALFADTNEPTEKPALLEDTSEQTENPVSCEDLSYFISTASNPSHGSLSEHTEDLEPPHSKVPVLDFGRLRPTTTPHTPRFIEGNVKRDISFNSLPITRDQQVKQGFFKSAEPPQWYDGISLSQLWDKKRYILIKTLSERQLLWLSKWFDKVIGVAFCSMSTMNDDEYQAFTTHCADVLSEYINKPLIDLMQRLLKSDDKRLELILSELDQEIQSLSSINAALMEELETLIPIWDVLNNKTAELNMDIIADLLNLISLDTMMSKLDPELIKSVKERFSRNNNIYIVKDSALYQHINTATDKARADGSSAKAIAHCRETLLSSQLLDAMTKPLP